MPTWNPIPRHFLLMILSTALVAISIPDRRSSEVLAQPYPAAGHKPGPSSAVECTGKIEPRQRYTRLLEPGERLLQIGVAQSARVSKGEFLASLANDTLHERLCGLEDKRMVLERERDQIQLTLVRAENTRASIQRIEKRIEEEKQLLKRLPDYGSEKKLSELREVKDKLEEDLRLLSKEVFIRMKNDSSLAALVGSLEKLAHATRAQMEKLEVRAPFAGIIVYAADEASGQMAGSRILELWDDKRLQVKATAFQHQLPLIQAGGRAVVFPHFFHNRSLSGTVRSISPSPLSENEDEFPKFPVVIDLDEQGADLLPGMGVTVRILPAGVDQR